MRLAFVHAGRDRGLGIGVGNQEGERKRRGRGASGVNGAAAGTGTESETGMGHGLRNMRGQDEREAAIGWGFRVRCSQCCMDVVWLQQ
jgi:hypothetical protein